MRPADFRAQRIGVKRGGGKAFRQKVRSPIYGNVILEIKEITTSNDIL